jgi:hypothetical protein
MNHNELRKQLLEVGPSQEISGHELCPVCGGLSPGVDMTGENIVHCPLRHDGHVVTVAAADRWWKEMAERRGR